MLCALLCLAREQAVHIIHSVHLLYLNQHIAFSKVIVSQFVKYFLYAEMFLCCDLSQQKNQQSRIPIPLDTLFFYPAA